MSKFDEFLKANKKNLNAQIERQKPQVIAAIEQEFVVLTAGGGTIVANQIHDQLNRVIRNLHLPSYLAVPIDLALGSIDFAQYAGKPIAQLAHLKDDLIYHIKASHL